MSVLPGCQSPSESSAPQLLAVVQEKRELTGIPSASGIEKVGNRYYVIGDDSPYLFCLNEAFETTQKIPLLNPASLSQGRIPKPAKPDLEAITSVVLEGQPYLLILGSGSTAQRNTAYLVPISGQSAGPPVEISLQGLYQPLRTDPKVVGTALLNIEGVATDEEYLYLLHRYSPGGQNVLITYTMAAITPFLQGRTSAPKPYRTQTWELPDLENIKTGFSGACSAIGGRILFTASAEESPDAVRDGEVYGSMVGWLHTQKSTSKPNQPSLVVPVTMQDGSLYKSKIESICIRKNMSDKSLEAVAVADNDNGVSELVLLQFSW